MKHSAKALPYLLFFVVGLLPLLGRAEAQDVALRRYALIVGANDGGSDRALLRYATNDASAISEVLEEIGGVAPEDRMLLLDPTRDGLEQAIMELEERLRDERAPGYRTEVLLYYSGHSDEDGLLLEGERLDYPTLRRALERLAADVRIIILDSCASGSLIREKGGKRRPPFMLDRSNSVKGHAFLTSSAQDEAAQESDRLKGSFFTKSLITGLRGAADATRDGKVTLNEAYQFAFQETLRRTERTASGPQHPAYDFRLAGTGDLVLTDLRAASAGMLLDEGLEGRLFVRDASGELAAELWKQKGQRVEMSFAPGDYELTLIQGPSVLEARGQLHAGQKLAMDMSRFASVPTEQTVRRGSAGSSASERAAASPFASKAGAVASSPSGTETSASSPSGTETSASSPSERETSASSPSETKTSFSSASERETSSSSASERETSSSSASEREAASPSPRANPGVGPVADADADSDPDSALSYLSASIGFLDDPRWYPPPDQTRVIPLVLSLFPPISTNPFVSPDETTVAAMGLVGTHDNRIRGLAASTVVSWVDGEMRGVQASSGVNVAGGEVSGIQAAGAVNVADSVNVGCQWAGAVNVARGPVRGVQAAGSLNIAGEVYGIQAAGGLNVAKDVRFGLQAAPINISTGDAGVQLGAINIAGGAVRSIQIGVLNVAEDVAAPIGVLSFVKNGYHNVGIWGDEMRSARVGFKTGGRVLYNHLALGMRGWEEGATPSFMAGAGLGVHRGKRLFFDLEVLTSSVLRLEPDFNTSMLLSLRVGAGIQLLEHLALVGGLSANAWAMFDNDLPDLDFDATQIWQGRDADVYFWPGMYGGVQF